MSPSTTPRRQLPPAPWYQDAIIYEARVRAFYDHDGDGIGDFRGMAERLDYLQDLGVTALWILPFYPSPLKDDGYDISDYTGVHPDCGTLDDFKVLLKEAHGRGLRVITELVINHTSDQHPWFQRARQAPAGSRWRNFYVWSDTPERYGETRIIFQDFEPSNWTWDPVAKAYYWHRFYSHQPDLNFDHPDVHRAVFKALDFWLGLGVDGLRLDAIPYLYEREGTNCENLPETHAFLKKLRRHVDEKFTDRMLLAEANQWPEDAVAYFGDGDECHMSFHFPLMPRLFMAVQMEDRFPILDILKQTPDLPDGCQWALFLRNHDELTLEMVTDEERDYMYRVYAQDSLARINLGIRRRLAPLLGNDRRKIALMNGLLFSLPGTPVVYYGDEIGMGDNFFLGDRNGVRTPMQWNPNKNAGFSRANPQRLYLPVIYDPEYHYETVNVETQNNSPSSLLRWMKQLIALRKRYPTFGRGSMQLLNPRNRKVLAFTRSYGDQDLLVLANLGGTVEYVELDLARFKGRIPIEIFGHNPFPRVGDLPYLLTLGPYAFYWFELARDDPGGRAATAEPRTIPELAVRGRWDGVFRGEAREALADAVAAFLPHCRWFAGKTRTIRHAEVRDVIPVPTGDDAARILLLDLTFETGGTDGYVVPVSFASGAAAERALDDRPETVVARVTSAGSGHPEGVLVDAMRSSDFGAALLKALVGRRPLKGENGRLRATAARRVTALAAEVDPETDIRPLTGEQGNSSFLYGRSLLFKLYRHLADGPNPDLEVSRYLTDEARFDHVAPVLGSLEYAHGTDEPATVGTLQGFVPNEGDAWRYTLDQLRGYFERVLGRGIHESGPPETPGGPLELAGLEPPPVAGDTLGAYLETARLLGVRTAELHLALARDTEDEAFAPVPFTTLYQRALYQSMRNLGARTFRLLRENVDSLAVPVREPAVALIDREDDVLDVFARVRGAKIDAERTRTHGDYHLGQVLYTGNDFVIVDFEGEPSRSVAERRIKRSPLRDVAGMLRSFDYAVQAVLQGSAGAGVVRAADRERLAPWARFWQRWVGAAFLRAYLNRAEPASFLPGSRADLERLLAALLLEKGISELAYELDNRPDWVGTPLHGVLGLLGSPQ